jgi:hydroxyacylglutathione hydrolase
MNRVTDSVSTLQSEIWKTNTGIVMDGDRVILVDPGILAREFDALLKSLRGKEIVAGFATHFHWDHILWPPELGPAPRFASAETVRLVTTQRERIVRTLDMFEESLATEHGLGPQWDRSLFFDLMPMEPGPGEIAGVICEIVDVSGHADGQVALVLPEHDVAFVADTLSDIETPSITEGVDRFERYLETLDRLQDVIDRVRWIVPGHGDVADRAEAQRRLDADRRYLEQLPGLVAAAPADQSDTDLATACAETLDETRATDGLSWDMHVANIRLLRTGTAG